MTENQSESESGAAPPRPSYVIRALQVESSAERKRNAPAPRGGATITQVASGDVYLIGGANREAHSFGDVYRLDLATKLWTPITPSGDDFAPRSGHSAVAIGDRIVVFGGINPTECALYEDVFLFDTTTHRWAKPLVEGWMPGARNAQAAIALTAMDGHERVLIYGGSSPDDGAFDDVYILHIPLEDRNAPLRWERRECAGQEMPEARELHAACFLTPTTVLFSGGRNRDGNVCTDMAVLDVEAWQWQLIPICEWNRCAHAAAAVDGVVLSFGGFDGGAILDDCWEYADNEESWLRANVQAEPSRKTLRDAHPETTEQDPAIPERFGHCGCAVELLTPSSSSDKRVQGLLVFGGMNAERDLNDLVLITPESV